jgi:AcrR family transcriptional regulator
MECNDRLDMAAKDYHHGNLRQALLEAAVAEIADVGLSAMSLRKVAARVGVTHPAASHHFGDKTGLLTALAAEGYRLLAGALQASRERGGDLLELGVTYLRFAAEHRPLFEVMFRPELLQRDDPELLAAQAAAGGELRGASAGRAGAHQQRVARGAWSFVHGFTTLWLAGNLDVDTLPQAIAEFRRVATTFTRVGLGPG